MFTSLSKLLQRGFLLLAFLLAGVQVSNAYAQEASSPVASADQAAQQAIFAEGTWTTDQGANTLINSFEVPGLTEATGLERQASMSGVVSTWASLSRDIRSAGQPQDLSSFDALVFTAYGMGDVQLFVEKASIMDANHYGHRFTLTPQPIEITIMLADLTLRSGEEGFTADDVTALAFYVMGDGRGQHPFALFIEDIRFVNSASSVAIEDEPFEQPEAYTLAQNYPNPFNPQTTIGFSLATASEVRLAVYDMLGREVEVLVQGLVSGGQHDVVFAAHDLPSGTYVYRLQAAEQTLTKTLVLMK